MVWSDFVCPWCYAGQDRTALLRQMGVAVTQLPYELHPETPLAGVDLSERTRDRFAFVHAECDESGDLPFVAPRRSPNSRLALEVAEVTRHVAPDAFDRLSEALFRAHFVDGLDIGDPAVIDALVTASGADAEAVRAGVEQGDGSQALADARVAALEAGVTGVPAWLVDGRLLIPGVQSRATFERLIARLR